MGTYTQLQKCISVLMIFVLLINFSGCISTRVVALSKSDLPLTYTNKYTYIVHSERFKFLLDKWTISDGILSGRINQIYSDKSYDVGNKIHLYFSTDSVIKIDKGESLSVPLDAITKAELQTNEVHGKYFIVIGCILGVVLVVCIMAASWALNIF